MSQTDRNDNLREHEYRRVSATAAENNLSANGHANGDQQRNHQHSKAVRFTLTKNHDDGRSTVDADRHEQQNHYLPLQSKWQQRLSRRTNHNRCPPTTANGTTNNNKNLRQFSPSSLAHIYTTNQRRLVASILSGFAVASPPPPTSSIKKAPRGATALAAYHQQKPKSFASYQHQQRTNNSRPASVVPNASNGFSSPSLTDCKHLNGKVHLSNGTNKVTPTAADRPSSATDTFLQQNAANGEKLPLSNGRDNLTSFHSDKLASADSAGTTFAPVPPTKSKRFMMLRLPIADRMVMRIADERDAVQIKTFTKWINKHTTKRGEFVTHLDKDLRDGRVLLSLIEILTGAKLPKEKNSLRFHCVQNVNTVLEFLEHKQIKLVNIRAEDIVDGNTKITLALVWTIVLHFHIADVAYKTTLTNREHDRRATNGDSRQPPTPITPQDAKAALLQWVQQLIQDYPVRVNDFSRSWRDGLAFCAILHRYCKTKGDEGGFDFGSVQRYYSNAERLKFAFQLAEHRFGVVPLLDASDVDTAVPDARSIMTYVSSLYDALVWEARGGGTAGDEREQTEKSRRHIMAEYLAQASALFQWMQTTVAQLSLNDAPSSSDFTDKQLAAQLEACRECKRVDVALRNAQRNGLHELWRQLQQTLSVNRRALSKTRVNLQDPGSGENDTTMRAEDLVTPNLTPTHIDELWQKFLYKLDDKEKKLVAWWSLKKADEEFGDELLLQKASSAVRHSRRKSSVHIATIPELDDDSKLIRSDFDDWITGKKNPTAEATEKMYQQNLQELIQKTEAASPATARRGSAVAGSKKYNLTLPLKSSAASDDMPYIDSTNNSDQRNNKVSRNNFFGLTNDRGSWQAANQENSSLIQSPPKTNLEPSSLNARIFTNHSSSANGGDDSITTLMSPPSPDHQTPNKQTSTTTRRPAVRLDELSQAIADMRLHLNGNTDVTNGENAKPAVTISSEQLHRRPSTSKTNNSRPPRARTVQVTVEHSSPTSNNSKVIRRSTSASFHVPAPAQGGFQPTTTHSSKSSATRSTSSAATSRTVNGSATTNKIPTTFARAITLQLYDPNTSTFFCYDTNNATSNNNPAALRPIKFEEAIEFGILDPAGLVVQDPRTHAILTLEEVLQAHVIDRARGSMVDPRTGQRLLLQDVLQLGWLREGVQPLTVAAAIRAGLFNAKTNLFRHPNNTNDAATNDGDEQSDSVALSSSRRRSSAANSHFHTLRAAIDAGIIDAHRTLIYDDGSKKFITLLEAIKNGLVEPVSARIRVCSYKMKNVPPALVAGGEGEKQHAVGLLQALESGYICDANNNSAKQQEPSTAGAQQRPPTLAQLIELGNYEQRNGFFRIRTNSDAVLLTLDEAIERGVVLAYEPTVKHPYYERRVLSLMTAVSIGLIDGERGVMRLPPRPIRPTGISAQQQDTATQVANQPETVDLVTAKDRGYLLSKVPDSVHYV